VYSWDGGFFLAVKSTVPIRLRHKEISAWVADVLFFDRREFRNRF